MKYLIALLATAGICHAETVIYTNQYGQPVAKAQTSGQTTVYSNQYGQPIGYAQVVPTPPQSPPIQLQMPVLPQIPVLAPLPLAPIMTY